MRASASEAVQSLSAGARRAAGISTLRSTPTSRAICVASTCTGRRRVTPRRQARPTHTGGPTRRHPANV